ncbi:hypothetical protein EA462_13380 [Natrarchaeobius halalkaliphilus]|uniref:Uncharacterized protein n=1 Tax=Natrarchaeobius halalkaliphilus TaxID=1679091 RepID=A0A3N6LJ35_9EURY|nr:hypothetical protein EA462_13380 [Natrarchaeobius halalkaliphilus]
MNRGLLNQISDVLATFDLDEAPHYSSLCRWEQQYRMSETGFSKLKEADGEKLRFRSWYNDREKYWEQLSEIVPLQEPAVGRWSRTIPRT